MHLCIFNPEHDLCLAKGRATYVPPQSAVDFARQNAAIMQPLYPGCIYRSAYDLQNLPEITNVVTWGWNVTLKWQLQRAGIDSALLPTDEYLDTLRALQHRTTILPLQPDCKAIHSMVEAEGLFIGEQQRWVLKAPWSGAGRGLRWVTGALSPNDRTWISKTIDSQRCVIAEPRRAVKADFALEYYAAEGSLRFVGYSLFNTEGGVYRSNATATDDEIVAYLKSISPSEFDDEVENITHWLQANIVPHYSGPIGIDLMACADSHIYVSEMNLRHTMGMVAHSKINHKPLTI